MPRTRTSADDMRALAIEDLAAALDAAGLRVERAGKRSLNVRLDDARFNLDVVPAAYATGARADELIDEPPPAGQMPVLVADRITAHARDRLAEAGWGWFDRRGHLRLRSPGLLVDTNVSLTTRERKAPEEPIRGRAGIAIAYRLLSHPDEPVSTTRSGLGFAPSTISEALSRLRDAGLIDDIGFAVTPELFWALADRWAPERTWLAEQPDPKASDTAGWCVTGTVAAAELGAPVVSTGAAPDFYVPGPVVVTIAARRYGVARDASVAAASIAVAPTSAVTDEVLSPAHQPWPLAHPVAIALDLAQDRARGREILEDWSPPERVW
jgi:DNA-binding transcriptional ArsR family regulator